MQHLQGHQTSSKKVEIIELFGETKVGNGVTSRSKFSRTSSLYCIIGSLELGGVDPCHEIFHMSLRDVQKNRECVDCISQTYRVTKNAGSVTRSGPTRTCPCSINFTAALDGLRHFEVGTHYNSKPTSAKRADGELVLDIGERRVRWHSGKETHVVQLVEECCLHFTTKRILGRKQGYYDAPKHATSLRACCISSSRARSWMWYRRITFISRRLASCFHCLLSEGKL